MLVNFIFSTAPQTRGGRNIRAALRRHLAKEAVSRQLLNHLIDEDGGNDDAGADERRGGREDG